MAEGNGDLNQRVSLFGELGAESFNKPHDYEALHEAQAHIAEGGFIVTLPQGVRDRINQPPESDIWMKTYATLTEEYQGRVGDRDLLIILHGASSLDSPQLVEARAEYAFGRRVEEDYLDILTKGNLPDGREIPIFTLESYLGTDHIPTTPHAIVAEIATEEVKTPTTANAALEELAASKGIKKAEREPTYVTGVRFNGKLYVPQLITSIDAMRADPLFAARVGGRKNTKEYLDTLARMGAKQVGNWHHLMDYNPEKRTGYRLLLGDQGLSYGACWGFAGGESRFIAVKMAPEDVEGTRKSYFFIAQAHGNGLPKPVGEATPEFLTKATQPQLPARDRKPTPPDGYGGTKTMTPPDTARLMADLTGHLEPEAPQTPPPPRARKTTAGANGNGHKIVLPPPPKNGSGGKA